jgi:kumamolisin
MAGERDVLPGSHRDPLPDAHVVGPVPADSVLEVTLVLRRRAAPPDPAGASVPLTSAELAEQYGADPADVAAVTAAVTAAGLQVIETDPGSRRIRVAGPAATMEQLFGTSLQRVRVDEPAGRTVEVRHRTGELSLPAGLGGAVTGVLGLDDRPQARTRLRPAIAAGTSYTPLDLARIYEFPEPADGTGQTLALLELGGGYGQADLDAYFAGLGITGPVVTAVGVDGAVNTPGQDPMGADGEVLLDIEVAGAIAPKAALVVYFAPNTDAGFLDGISAAAHATPAPTALSISWGQREDQWTAQARDAMDQAFADAALMGVTVLAAAGDSGSSDQPGGGTAVHVDFPASSPHVLGCGGTSLVADPETGAVTSESVWNDGPGKGATGGGISDAFGVPAWQAGVGVSAAAGATRPTSGSHGNARPGAGRGVPDVAGVADPRTGYQVLVDGQAQVYGGTSAVAPLWAGLVCRLTQSMARPLGLVAPSLYAGASPGVSPAGFRDITAGDNGHYHAGPGWDACTGLGVPVGTALLAALQEAHSGNG